MRSDGLDRKTSQNDLYGVSKRMVDDMHRKYGEVDDSLESEQADGGLRRVDLTSDASSMDVQEDAQEQRRHVSQKEIRQGGSPMPPSEDCEAFR